MGNFQEVLLIILSLFVNVLYSWNVFSFFIWGHLKIARRETKLWWRLFKFFLSYVIFDQQRKIIFIKSLAPLEKIYSPLLTHFLPKNSKSVSLPFFSNIENFSPHLHKGGTVTPSFKILQSSMKVLIRHKKIVISR